MSYLIASGSIQLNGINLVQIKVPEIQSEFIRVIRALSSPIEGTIGQIVYIEVYDETTMKLRPNYDEEIEQEVSEYFKKRKNQ